MAEPLPLPLAMDTMLGQSCQMSPPLERQHKDASTPQFLQAQEGKTKTPPRVMCSSALLGTAAASH